MVRAMRALVCLLTLVAFSAAAQSAPPMVPVEAPPPVLPPPSNRVMPRVMPYYGGEVPAGAQLRSRPRTGLVTAGGVIFGVSYIISVFSGVICLTTGANCPLIGTIFLPVIGPTIAGAAALRDPGRQVLVLGVFDSLVQAAGATMLILGIALPQQDLVYADASSAARPRLTLLPMAPGAPLGVSISLTNF